MTNKFTEEQFNILVEIQEDQYPDNLFYVSKGNYESISYTVSRVDKDLWSFITQNNLGNETVAIMNPATRELAHEQFVEEEKKYVWRLKTDSDMIVSKTSNGYWYLDRFPALNKEFTRIEIEKSPFNPDWFDKEEI